MYDIYIYISYIYIYQVFLAQLPFFMKVFGRDPSTLENSRTFSSMGHSYPIFPKTGWTHQGHFFGPGGLGGNGYERYHLGEWREFGATLDPRTEGISLLSDDSTHVLFSAMGGERKQMKTVMFQESDWMN